MPELVGADIERLRAMASSFEHRAEAITSMERQVTAACGELHRFWHGADAADFVGRWQSNHRPRLLAVAAGLVDVSQLLSGNADEQHLTSSVGGGATTGGGRFDRGAGGGGGGGGWGGGFGLPILGDGWNLVSEFATDTWDGITDTAGTVWDGATDVAVDTWDGLTDTAGTVWGGITGTAGTVWGGLTSAAGAAVDETGHRLSEFGQYGLAYTERWLDNPIQSVFDELTFTGQFERLVGAGSILFLGGEYQENLGNGDAEFITGLPIRFNDAITLGHSVLIDDPRPSGGLLEHELQHVDDVEAVGGVGFYSSYLGNWIGNIIGGQDPSIGGEAYENIWWEQRAHATQDGNPPSDLDFGRFDPRNWFD